MTFVEVGSPVSSGVLTPLQAQAYEGSRFLARATPAAGGVGVALGVQTSFSDTANIALALSNGEAAGGKSYLIDYVRMRCTAAGASTTSAEVSVEVDTINRYSSGGSSLAIQRMSPGGPASNALVRVGAVTAAAAGTSRFFVGSCLVRVAAAPCWLVNDVIVLTFGGGGIVVPANVAGPLATTIIQAEFPFGPALVPPGGSLLVHLANVANAVTPPSFEFEAAWVERQ